MEKVKKLLENTALKATPQRLSILKEIIKSGHIDLDSIYKNLSKSFPSMSLATVYKNIHTLKKHHLIKELSIENEKSKYEIAAQKEHSHFVCTQCGSVIDVEVDKKDLLAQVENNANNFDVQSCDVYFYGVCEKCKNSAKRSN